jgi:uncharacterized membrane protein YkvI
MSAAPAAAFRRVILPAFAFKAVVIGGGYATGRELAEYFLPSGPRGGLLAIALAAMLWSFICVVTFRFAQATRSTDYRSFFRALLGRFAPLFEISYFLLVILLLSVFGAAAGSIGAALFGWDISIGTLLLAIAITAAVSFGNESVEAVFKYVTILLYGTYAIFFLLCLTHFGGRIEAVFSAPAPLPATWPLGGLTYAGYNIVGAVVILPVLRHLASPRDAVFAGLLCGPFAMLPAFLFFICMMAAYPEIASATLPADTLLQQLDLPVFRVLFQIMIFAALFESGSGIVHAVNQRVAHSWTQTSGKPLRLQARLAIAVLLLFVATQIAGRFGLVVLIARGYRLIAAVLLCIYVLPLFTLGLARLRRPASPTRSDAESRRETQPCS